MIYNVFGYKVIKENGEPFGYDKMGENIVVNSVESEIVKYVCKKFIDNSKAVKELPKHWVKYLEEENRKSEEKQKYANMTVASVENLPDLIKTYEHKPIIDKETWKAVCEKMKAEE